MKYIKHTLLYIILLGLFYEVKAQKTPSLIIDSTEIQFGQVSMPYWLKAGQKIGLGVNAKTVSVLEFTINGIALEFSRVLSVTSNQTVPSNKAWKIEGIGLNKSDTTNTLGTVFLSGGSTSTSTSSTNNMPVIFQSPKKFETPGTYTWNVPPGVTSICIEVWGGGGGGNSSNFGASGAGGGGGGYGYACFKVTPGTQYTVTVGDVAGRGAGGGTSSVGSLISASGGGGGAGNSGSGPSGTNGGAGGTSNAAYNITGENGGNGSGGGFTPAKGGNGANGGNGGAGAGGSNAGNGSAVGGGGGGTYSANSGFFASGIGARGQVYIYF
jgi:hypothetical protein